jgi:hypothetical protein
MSSVNSLSSLFNNTYNYYSILYCNKRILKKCDMEENREAAEAVTIAYSKDGQNKYSGVTLNIIIIHMIITVVKILTVEERENKVLECTPKTSV